MAQLVDYSVILMVSVLLEDTVQRDILEPCHGDSDKLLLPPGTEHAPSCQANVMHASWCEANLCHIDARVEEGRNSVYGIVRKLQKNCFCSYVSN